MYVCAGVCRCSSYILYSVHILHMDRGGYVMLKIKCYKDLLLLVRKYLHCFAWLPLDFCKKSEGFIIFKSTSVIARWSLPNKDSSLLNDLLI